MDYSKLSDKELLDITNPKINKGPIPLKAVQEVQKRFPEKFVNKTVTS